MALELNRPDRHDFHLMKLAQTVVAVNTEKGKQVPGLKSFQVGFDFKPPADERPPTPEEKKRMLKEDKARIGALFGVKL